MHVKYFRVPKINLYILYGYPCAVQRSDGLSVLSVIVIFAVVAIVEELAPASLEA